MPTSGKLACYVINLDRVPERWNAIHEAFSRLNFPHTRFPAVDLTREDCRAELPRVVPNLYYWLIGTLPTRGQIGCFASHWNVYRLFLESDAEFALVCEDDVLPDPDFPQAVEEALRYAHTWDYLRLLQGDEKWVIPYADLPCGRRLGTGIKSFIPQACYLVNRKGAEILTKTLQNMYLPNDVQIHRGWWGLREATLYPYPVHLSEDSKISGSGYSPTFKKSYPWHPVWWTKRLGRVYLRLIRYSYQGCRALRRWFFRPRAEENLFVGKNRENDG